MLDAVNLDHGLALPKRPDCCEYRFYLGENFPPAPCCSPDYKPTWHTYTSPSILCLSRPSSARPPSSNPPRYFPDMFCRSFLLYTVLATLYSTVFASPTISARSDYSQDGIRTLADAVNDYPQLLPLKDGNARFRQSIADSDNPDLLWSLTANGQHPEFLFLGCRLDFTTLWAYLFLTDARSPTQRLQSLRRNYLRSSPRCPLHRT